MNQSDCSICWIPPTRELKKDKTGYCFTLILSCLYHYMIHCIPGTLWSNTETTWDFPGQENFQTLPLKVFLVVITLLLSLWKSHCGFKHSFWNLCFKKKMSEFQVIFLEVSFLEVNKYLVGGAVANFPYKYKDIESVVKDQMLTTGWIQLSLLNCKASPYIHVSILYTNRI